MMHPTNISIENFFDLLPVTEVMNSSRDAIIKRIVDDATNEYQYRKLL